MSTHFRVTYVPPKKTASVRANSLHWLKRPRECYDFATWQQVVDWLKTVPYLQTNEHLTIRRIPAPKKP